MIALLFLSVVTGLFCLALGAALGAAGWSLLLWYVAGCWVGAAMAFAALLLMRHAPRRMPGDPQTGRAVPTHR